MDFSCHLKKYLDDNQIKLLLDSFNQDNKHAILINTNKIDKEHIKKIYPNLIDHPIVNNAFIYDKNEYDLGKSLLHELGAFYIQEPSAMLPSYFLDVDDDDIVLDMCSAPGGKSIQVSLKNKNIVIISNDISLSRQYLTLENIERLGIDNICLTNIDFSKEYNKFNNYFSKIILDAPCSGSAMFRKDEKMKQDWNYQKVIKYASIQKELILKAYKMLKPGGEMIYSTCSFSYEEDEEVVKFLLDNSDAVLIDFDINPLFYKSESNIGIHIFPHLFPGEGHYIAKIKKPGILTNIKNKIEKQVIYGNNKFKQIIDLNRFKIPIIRNGVKLSTFKGNYESYEHHFARTLKSFPKSVDLNKEETIKYIKGEQIDKSSPFKGEILLKYNDLSIDFAKTDGQIIKNRYPKGLRKLIKN